MEKEIQGKKIDIDTIRGQQNAHILFEETKKRLLKSMDDFIKYLQKFHNSVTLKKPFPLSIQTLGYAANTKD